MDVCLQSSVEIAYDLKDCADFLLASPNLSVSHEYSHALKNLTTGTTPEELGKMLVSEYYHCNYAESMPFEELSRSSGGSMYTMSLINLDGANLESLKSGIDSLADSLLSLKKSDSDAFLNVYKTLLVQDTSDLSACKGLSYAGSFAILSDIGFFADGILSDFSDKTELCAAATSIKSSLENVISYSYGGLRTISETKFSDLDYDDFTTTEREVTDNQMYLTGGTDYLTNQSVSTELSGNYYGLTIETQNAESEESIKNQIKMYIEYFTREEAKGTTFGELCKELSDALVSSGEYSKFEAALLVSELKSMLNDIDYVSYYADYTGFSEKWAQVIAAWCAHTNVKSE